MTIRGDGCWMAESGSGQKPPRYWQSHCRSHRREVRLPWLSNSCSTSSPKIQLKLSSPFTTKPIQPSRPFTSTVEPNKIPGASDSQLNHYPNCGWRKSCAPTESGIRPRLIRTADGVGRGYERGDRSCVAKCDLWILANSGGFFSKGATHHNSLELSSLCQRLSRI